MLRRILLVEELPLFRNENRAIYYKCQLLNEPVPEAADLQKMIYYKYSVATKHAAYITRNLRFQPIYYDGSDYLSHSLYFNNDIILLICNYHTQVFTCSSIGYKCLLV